MTTPITLPIPYAELTAPLTWEGCKAITDAYQAACAARFPGQWVKPSAETLTHWAFAEAAELAIAKREYFEPDDVPDRDAILRVCKEMADVLFVVRQIGHSGLRGQSLKAALIEDINEEILNSLVGCAAFRLVAHDNMRRLATATIAPDGKVTKSPDYDTSQVYGWIAEVIRMGKADNT